MVNATIFCPYCGKELINHEFQTKDLGQNMVHYNLIEGIAEYISQGKNWHLMIYGDCTYCHRWIELDISRCDRKLSLEVEKIIKEKEEKLKGLSIKNKKKVAGQ